MTHPPCLTPLIAISLSGVISLSITALSPCLGKAHWKCIQLTEFTCRVRSSKIGHQQKRATGAENRANLGQIWGSSLWTNAMNVNEATTFITYPKGKTSEERWQIVPCTSSDHWVEGRWNGELRFCEQLLSSPYFISRTFPFPSSFHMVSVGTTCSYNMTCSPLSMVL